MLQVLQALSKLNRDYVIVSEISFFQDAVSVLLKDSLCIFRKHNHKSLDIKSWSTYTVSAIASDCL